MRLAAEYQQRTRKQEEKDDSGRRYIVRLGKGLPNDEKRKRGISLSQQNSHISEQSLGKNEVSREKEREQLLSSHKQTFLPKKAPEEKVLISAATYGSRPQKMSGYAAEHLADARPREAEKVVSNTRYLSGVRSQESLGVRPLNQKMQEQNVAKVLPPHLSNAHYISAKFIPPADNRPLSKDPRNFVEINSKIVEYPSNLKVYETKPVENNQLHLFRSNPTREQVIPVRLKSGEPVKLNLIQEARSRDKVITNSQRSSNAKQQLARTTKNTEKIIPDPKRNDPYSLSRLKLTKKNQDHEMESQQLKQTKKYPRGLPECKEISCSSSVSGDSKTNALFSRTGLISLWDANKVESIVSLKQSREFKVQQSEIMLDYFNPSESRLRKF